MEDDLESLPIRVSRKASLQIEISMQQISTEYEMKLKYVAINELSYHQSIKHRTSFKLKQFSPKILEKLLVQVFRRSCRTSTLTCVMIMT